jgi:DNA end-binding protein Ku
MQSLRQAQGKPVALFTHGSAGEPPTLTEPGAEQLFSNIPLEASMRPIWQGDLSFLLVNIPVALYAATSRKELHFRLLHKETGTPIEYRKYCPECGKEVDWEDIVKGYEIEKGKFVMLTDEDFEKADVERTHAIDIIDFVQLDEISPAYFDHPYYLIPQSKGAKTYHLLVRALKDEGKVGIAKVVIKTREYLAAIIPQGDGLLLETLFFGYEVNPIEEYNIPPVAEISQRELRLAKQIVGELTDKFEISKYTDDYREKLLAIIKQKAEGKRVVAAKPKPKKKEVESLTASLQRSLKEVEKHKKAA